MKFEHYQTQAVKTAIYSDADVITGETLPVNLTAGDDIRNIDVGVRLKVNPLTDTVSIGDFAWFDRLGDGIQSDELNGQGKLVEGPVPGVIVRLYKPGVSVEDEDIFISKAVTGNEGKFKFPTF